MQLSLGVQDRSNAFRIALGLRMLRLYSGSGSAEIQLCSPALSSDAWERLRRNACRFLRESGDFMSAETLEKTSFELWDGTNDFGDEFEVLYLRTTPREYIELEKVVEAGSTSSYRSIAKTLEKLGRAIRFIAVDVETDDEVQNVAQPALKITSEVVEHALSDAETLIRARGATSGLDRVHTAFHGYLKAVCEAAAIPFGSDPSITELFKLVRERHPALQLGTPTADTIKQILRSMAAIVDVLNPLRNRSSVAHPNDVLLEEPEAMLAINSVRTLLHYLNMRLR